MLTKLNKFPAPYFGGKTDAAETVWQALGDPAHYVEPLCGSMAVLLNRPHPCNRPYHSETVNDKDGLLINAIRSLRLSPDATAEAASWPVSEACLHARHLALVRWVHDTPLERLMADPFYHEPMYGGMYLYGLSAWIGSGWCEGHGPWHIDPATGRVVRRQNGQPGVRGKRPHLSNDGRGVHRPGTREPGVQGKRPHLSDNGTGVHRPGTREPGVQGQQTPQDEAVAALITADYAATEGFHPWTMPELRRWFHALSARLRHVRIVHGDWSRVVTSGALKMLTIRQGKGIAGVFLDPPYALTEREAGLYTHDSAPDGALQSEVRAWCLAHGDDPDYRIVLAGFAGEGHEVLEAQGWTVRTWFQSGFLKGGMGQLGGGSQQHRERLWCSPHCLQPDDDPRQGSFAWGAEALS